MEASIEAGGSSSVHFHRNFRLLPWKLRSASMERDLLPSTSTEAQIPSTSMEAPGYFHLLPWKLPPTSMEVDPLPAYLKVDQLFRKQLQFPWKQQTPSIHAHFHLPNKTQGYVKANGTRSTSIWMLVEVTGEVDKSL